MINTGYLSALRREFHGYSIGKFQKDVLAGITCTAVALPLALAFGVSSGADAASGLICAIIAGIVIGALSGASYQISGPTGAMTAILASLAMKHGLQGVFIAGLFSGIILLLFALVKAGKLVSLIPMPVMTGFTSGIAIFIALGQIDNCFGTVSKGTSVIEKLASYGGLGFNIQPLALMYALLAVGIMILWPKKLQQKFPSSLLAIIITLAIQMIIKAPVAMVGAIPRTLLPATRLTLSALDLGSISSFIAPAFSIALLGMVESLLCGAAAGKMKGEKLNATQELIAQGVGNIIIPFFGGVPATAAIARTSVNIKAGGQTRLVSIIHAIGILLSMFLLSPFMAQIPLAALGGVLWMTAWRMNDWASIKKFFRLHMKTSIAQFLVTMICTVVLDLTTAILIGILFSMLLFVLRAKTDLHIEIDTPKDAGENCRVVYVDGLLFFGTQDVLSGEVAKLKGKNIQKIIFSLRGVSVLDHSGVEELEGIVASCEKEHIEVFFCGLQQSVYSMMKRLKFIERLGEDHFYSSAVTAIEALERTSN